MKKVLVIAYLYPPIFNSGTRRSLEFVNHLPDHGWTPTVLTLADPEPGFCDDSLMAEVRPGTRIATAPLASKVIAGFLTAPFARLDVRRRVANTINWRLLRRWNVPDTCAAWGPTALAEGKRLLRAERYDAIYATGWPWTAFLVAEKLSRATGVPFIVDYRDLWQSSDAEWDKRTWLQRRVTPWLEKRVLRRAAGVIATTESFLRLLPQDVLPARRFAITNGFNADDFAGAAPAPAPDGPITIAYTGVWRPGYGPDDLYRAVRLLKDQGAPGLSRLKVVTAGFEPGPASEFGIADLVEERGRVNHGAAIDMMTSASAVYLPVSQGLYEHASLPGKLFDYFGCGRPILASAQPGSEVAAALDRVGGARRVDPGDVPALAALIARLCDGAGDLFAPRLPAELAAYTRSSLTGKLGAALDAIAAPQRAGAAPTIAHQPHP